MDNIQCCKTILARENTNRNAAIRLARSSERSSIQFRNGHLVTWSDADRNVHAAKSRCKVEKGKEKIPLLEKRRHCGRRSQYPENVWIRDHGYCEENAQRRSAR